jgi:hypothetical protein
MEKMLEDEIVIDSHGDEEFFSRENFFSRIELGGGCVLRRKLAVGSVRSQKPRITPLQTTHKTSIRLRRFKIVPSENPKATILHQFRAASALLS